MNITMVKCHLKSLGKFLVELLDSLAELSSLVESQERFSEEKCEDKLKLIPGK